MNTNGAADAAGHLVGSILGGRYRILEKLGEGAMGAVYLGEHLKIGRRDAIKVLRQPLARDDEAIARFLRGARNVSAVRHPNVCAIYDFSESDDGLQFLAMEYVAGESLRDTLAREGALPLPRALHIAVKVASALQAAHDVGVIHRDLKPGNIMLVPRPNRADEVKVVDFDIAKGPEPGGEEVTRMGFVVGTPEYMSPEQLMGEPLDGRSDVYSLGLVLFRMLAGALPFRAETTQEIMIQRLTHTPLKLTEARPGLAFPPRVQAALDRALERRAADRWASAEDLEQELAAIAAEADGVSASTPRMRELGTPAAATREEIAPTRIAAIPGPPSSSALAASPQSARTGRRWVFAGAAAFVIVAAGAAALLLSGGGEQQGIAATRDDTALQVGAQSATAPDAAATRDAGSAGAATSPPRNAGETSRTGERGGTAPRQQVVPGVDAPGLTPPAAPTIAPERASDVLFQQLDLLTASPDERTLAAVLDTARAVYAMRSLPERERSLAAYVIGSAHDARREWTLCFQWVDSALVLQPGGPGFADLREKCRGLAR